MTIVTCSLMLLVNGSWTVFQLKGVEDIYKERNDEIYVDFTTSWPVELKGQSPIRMVNNNDCLYIQIEELK